MISTLWLIVWVHLLRPHCKFTIGSINSLPVNQFKLFYWLTFDGERWRGEEDVGTRNVADSGRDGALRSNTVDSFMYFKSSAWIPAPNDEDILHRSRSNPNISRSSCKTTSHDEIQRCHWLEPGCASQSTTTEQSFFVNYYSIAVPITWSYKPAGVQCTYTWALLLLLLLFILNFWFLKSVDASTVIKCIHAQWNSQCVRVLIGMKCSTGRSIQNPGFSHLIMLKDSKSPPL